MGAGSMYPAECESALVGAGGTWEGLSAKNKREVGLPIKLIIWFNVQDKLVNLCCKPFHLIRTVSYSAPYPHTSHSKICSMKSV